MGAAAESGRFREWTRRTIEPGKMTFDFGNDGAMLDRARGGHHDVGRPIVTGEVGAQLAPVKRPHRFRRAQDGTAERLVGKRDELQMLENEIIGRIGDCADLLYDDVLLAQQFLAIERRLGKDIGEHVLRRRVPLKAICSRKWEMPCSSRCSSRLPEAIQTPSDAVSRCGIASVTTLMPDFRVVTSTLMLPLLPAPPGSLPGQTSQPPIDRRGAPLCVPAVH